MHGRIQLESQLGQGTTATFWIPFNKPQFHDGAALIDIGSLPDRLQSEMSVSCSSSDFDMVKGAVTPPTSSFMDKAKTQIQPRSFSMTHPVSLELEMSPAERSEVKILLVEDK